MKRTGIITVCLVLSFAIGWEAQSYNIADQQLPAAYPGVYFSPKGGARQAILEQVEKADKEIVLALYYFTDAGLADALIQARQRGIAVSVLLDKSQRRGRHSQAQRLEEGGVTVIFDSKHRIFHHKFMIVDGMTVITGSQNWTKSAETANAENTLTFVGNTRLAERFREEFLRLAAQVKVPTERKSP